MAIAHHLHASSFPLVTVRRPSPHNSQYFEKKNSLKELYRAVVQRRPILAMLEPDATQEGGLDKSAVEKLITNEKLDKFKLRKKHTEWNKEGELLAAAYDHPPDEADVRKDLFATPPVEWNRSAPPSVQTMRLSCPLRCVRLRC